jgi:hypothetical protein
MSLRSDLCQLFGMEKCERYYDCTGCPVLRVVDRIARLERALTDACCRRGDGVLSAELGGMCGECERTPDPAPAPGTDSTNS